MQQIVMLWFVSIVFAIASACSSGSKGDNPPADPEAADLENDDEDKDKAEPDDLTKEEEFVAICEKSAGEESQHKTSDAIRQWFAEEFNAFVACQDVYAWFNTPNFPAPLFLIEKDVSDLSLLRYFENLGTFVSINNPIEDWSALGGASGLEVVAIEGSTLTKVPDELLGKPLNRLILANSPITDFSNLAQITTLQIISLVDLNISSIPAEVASSPNLQLLILDHNPLTNFDSLENIPELTVLSLFNTSITAIPAQIANLEKLAVLEVSNNDLSGADAFVALANKESLKELYMEGTNITALPAELGTLTGLEILFISENTDLADFAAINAHPSLLGIRMNNTSLDEIPAEIPSIEQLEALGANRNNIEDINIISDMESLVSIGLAENPIAANKTPDNCPIDAVSPGVKAFCTSP